MRIPKEHYLQKPLRVHAFLADVPLHDVWAFRLQHSRKRKTLRDFRALLSDGSMETVNPVVKLFFKLRTVLGQVFGWDGQTQQITEDSYIHRLTAEDREKSICKPGSSTIDPFHLIYECKDEVLEEAMNTTVHAFSLMKMEPVSDGHVVYWAIYVKKVSFWTPVYMALIDPFRRLFIYPAIIKKAERAWVSS